MAMVPHTSRPITTTTSTATIPTPPPMTPSFCGRRSTTSAPPRYPHLLDARIRARRHARDLRPSPRLPEFV